MARPKPDLVADARIHLVVAIVERVRGRVEVRARKRQPIAQECAEKVIAAIIVQLARAACVGLARVRHHLRHEVGHRPLQVLARDRMLDERVATSQELDEVTGDVEAAVEIGLVERRYRDRLGGVPARQLLVVEHDVIAQQHRARGRIELAA
jgi:hypothetical protein